MTTPKDLEAKFWKALDADRTMMLGLEGRPELAPRPMTGLIEHGHGPIWFFTARDNAIVEHLGGAAPGFATFVSKGHDLFASVHGMVTVDNDRAVIDRLWNRYVAAWFEGGKDDPSLTLLRFDADRAEIWADASSLVAGIKILLGMDPKKEYRDKVAEVRLD
ncbi:MAG: pyridoxamine 5'-phosphate oxidase family protein [Sphingomonadales bacterium]